MIKMGEINLFFFFLNQHKTLRLLLYWLYCHDSSPLTRSLNCHWKFLNLAHRDLSISFYMMNNSSSQSCSFHGHCNRHQMFRLLSGPGRRQHITPVQLSLHWLPVRSRREFKVLTYKALHSQAPSWIKELIEPSHPPRAPRSEGSGLLVARKVSKIRSGGRSFSFFGPSTLEPSPGLCATGGHC